MRLTIMNSFQKSLARIIATVRAMSAQARMMAALVLSLIVVSAAYLLNAGVANERVHLFGGKSVDPAQLSQMEAAFAKAGLNEATIEENCISVPRGQQSRYLGALADADALPHNFGDTLRRTLESNSILTDKKKREEMLKVAMQMELSKLIGELNGIERATVIYDVQLSSGLQQKREVRASVTVKPEANRTLTRQQVQQIRSIVGPAIGTSPQQVTVVDTEGATYTAEGEDNQTPLYDVYAETQQTYEQLYKEKIQAALSFIPGAVVTVNVELNSEVEDSARSIRIDPRYRPNESAADRSGAHAVIKGMQPIDLGGSNSPAAIDLSDADGYETRHVKRVGLTPKRVSVSVGLPGAYLQQLFQERNNRLRQGEPDAAQFAEIETEIRAKIESHVAGVMPTAEGQDRLASSVTVTAFPEMPQAESKLLFSQSEQAIAWLNEHREMVITVVSSLLGLIILGAILRSRKGKTGGRQQDDLEDANEAIPQPMLVRTSHHRPVRSVFCDELSDIVREDPTAAAKVLRIWIGSAN